MIKLCKGDVLANSDDNSIISCETCGYAHIKNMPNISELEDLYAKDFYESDIPLYIKRYMQDIDWWKITYTQRLELLGQLVPNAVIKSVLDVGSGPGLFLKFAIEDGWKALGVEPSKVAVEHTKSLGANAIEGFFDQKMVDQLEPVSAIHASEVLEHVPNPGEMLDLFHQALHPDGVICICVPNDFNVFQDT